MKMWNNRYIRECFLQYKTMEALCKHNGRTFEYSCTFAFNKLLDMPYDTIIERKHYSEMDNNHIWVFGLLYVTHDYVYNAIYKGTHLFHKYGDKETYDNIFTNRRIVREVSNSFGLQSIYKSLIIEDKDLINHDNKRIKETN